jgi:hypothetical protein
LIKNTSLETEKQMNNMRSELNYYKNKLESVETVLYNSTLIVSGVLITYGLLKLFSYDNAHNFISRLDNMGSPILKINIP